MRPRAALRLAEPTDLVAALLHSGCAVSHAVLCGCRLARVRRQKPRKMDRREQTAGSGGRRMIAAPGGRVNLRRLRLSSDLPIIIRWNRGSNDKFGSAKSAYS